MAERKREPIAYLAGLLGFSEAGKLFYNSVFIPLIAGIGFEIRDPWVLTPEELADSASKISRREREKKRRSINRAIGRNNTRAVEEADIIIAVLDGADVDSGTAAEIGYGAAKGKKIFGYRGDFRMSGENVGCAVNLQVEYFISLNGGKIFRDLISLKKALIKYRKDFLKK